MAFFIGVAPSNRGCANGNPRTYDRHDLTPLNLRLKVLNQLFICMAVSHRHANSIIQNASLVPRLHWSDTTEIGSVRPLTAVPPVPNFSRLRQSAFCIL
jgi:hypothetical protein